MDDILLDVQGVSHCFRLGRNSVLRALDGVSFQLRRGEIFGLVGESGSGKSTMARCIMSILRPTAGAIRYLGVNICDPGQFRAHKELLQTSRQLIFQDSASSLDPRMTVADIIAEPMAIHRTRPPRGSLRNEAAFQLKCVGLDQGYLDRRPGELSGGQRQRVAIARALSMGPELLVADEPIASLDVSIQAQIINLLKDLQINLGLTYVFISHDLSVVKYITDQVLVMYLGNAMEQGNTEEIFKNPLHPYTKALFSALPVPNPNVKMNRIILEGDIPSPANPPEGCKFHTRCSHCMKACKYKAPEYTEAEPDHFVACHLYNKEIMENLAFYDEEYDNLLIRRQAEEEEQRRKKENGKFYRFKTRLFGFFGTVKAKVCGLFTRKKADGTGSDGKKTADSGEKRKQEAEKEENESEIR